MKLFQKMMMVAMVAATAPMAHAQEFDCRAVLQAFRAEPVPGLAAPDNGPCEEGQLVAFLRNEAAMARAEPVTEVEALYGAWLGDDALRYLSRVSLPGTELLIIGPGQEDGSLFITQYWLKANVPDSDLLPWDDEGYAGWVARGHLTPLGGGRYAPGFFQDEAFVYSGIRLEHGRSYELRVLDELNHFEIPLTFRRSGDVLVLDSERLHPLARTLTPHVTTYTRVDRQAVDMALMLVVALERSYGRDFDCFVHQLSVGAGPLIDAFAPYGIEDVRTWLDALLANNTARMALIEQMESDTPPSDAAARMQDYSDAYFSIIQSPMNLHFVDRLANANALGCPAVY